MKKPETGFKQSSLTTQILAAIDDAQGMYYSKGLYNCEEVKKLQNLYSYIKENQLDVRLVSRDY